MLRAEPAAQRGLRTLGYTTTCLTGRVLWGLPADSPLPPRTHMLLRVELPDGPHIVDAGFGIASITGALALRPDVEQSTPHNTFRLIADERTYRLEARERAVYRVMYRFDLAESCFSDLAMANFYLAHDRASLFRNELMLARADHDRRYTLHGGADGVRLGVRHVGGPVERRALESPAEVRAAFEQEFQLDLDGLTDLDAALARLF